MIRGVQFQSAEIMKRNRRRIKPSWQTVPMKTLVEIVRFWEVLKILRLKAEHDPEASSELRTLLENFDEVLKSELVTLDAIIPNAREKAADWLNSPGKKAEVLSFDADNPRVVFTLLTLWEGSLAIEDLAGEQEKKRWLDALPLEAGLLITRIENRLAALPR